MDVARDHRSNDPANNLGRVYLHRLEMVAEHVKEGIVELVRAEARCGELASTDAGRLVKADGGI